MSVHLPSSVPRTEIQQKKTEEKNNLLSVGVLKGFVMHGIMYAFLWHFYKSRGKMFQNYVSFKHLVVNFLCESPIDANNLVLRKTKQPCWGRDLVVRKPGFLPLLQCSLSTKMSYFY